MIGARHSTRARWTPAWKIGCQVGWQLGWPRLWRDRWRWLARRWAFALAGLAVGWLVVGAWHFETVQALWDSEARVQDLKAKLNAQEQVHTQTQKQTQLQPAQTRQAPGNAALSAPAGPPAAMARWPTPGTQAAVWPQMGPWMAQRGLRLLSMRPEPPSPAGTWPSQAVALRLQGRFDDWVAAWAALNAPGPLWSLERLRITPQEGGVAIDAVLRLWLSPESRAKPHLAGAPVPTALPIEAVQLALRSGMDAPVFVATPSQALASTVVAAGLPEMSPKATGAALASSASPTSSPTRDTPMPVLSPDPAHWPLDQVRLAGVWQFAHDAQLILQAGPHWVRAHVGLRIGPDGHVVHSIQAHEVHLRAGQGPVWVIGLEKAKP